MSFVSHSCMRIITNDRYTSGSAAVLLPSSALPLDHKKNKFNSKFVNLSV